MKVAVAQINTTAGDVEGNLDKVKDNVARAASQGADLVVFPELTLSGWMPMDLVREEGFLRRNEAALAEVAAAARDVAVLVGHVRREEGGRFTSAASLFVEGKCARTLGAVALEERSRHSVPGDPGSAGGIACFELGGARVGIAVGCVPASGVSKDALAGAELLIGMCAWPVYRGADEERRQAWARVARTLGVQVVAAGLVGGNGTAVFDGCSFALDTSGELLAAAPAFEEALWIVDVDSAGGRAEGDGAPAPIAHLYGALKLGLADYVRENGFADVVLGLSGGIDSAVVAAIAADALGPEHVTALAMPSAYTSQASTGAARAVAGNLGVAYRVIPIEELRGGFGTALAPVFAGTEPGATEENIQARIRGTLLMAHANKFGAIALAAGNRSELAMGYCTLYGDTAGGLAVIGDVPKTVVYELARHINRRGEVIPQAVIERAPSAELKPDQTDQDDLPPYEVLDGILECYLDERMDPADIPARGFDQVTVDEVVARCKWAAFKRRQVPPALRVYSRGCPWPDLPLAGRLTPRSQT